MNRRLFLRSASMAILGQISRLAAAQDSALFAQSASATLEQHFGSGSFSWILLDRSGSIIAEKWADSNRPISPGSLLKPFVALAYGQQHNFVFPHVHCAGTRDRCWLPRGHGTLGLEDALARSCNAYFLSLANHLDCDRAAATLARLGLAGPHPNADPATLVGLESGWRETPQTLARAYLALICNHEPIGDRIANSMQMAAQTGTATAVDLALGARAALAKTGTAACTHHPRATADGFAVVLYPAGQPRILLLLRMHGATGAQASAQAGAILRAIGMRTP